MSKNKKQYELLCDPDKGIRAIDSGGNKSAWYPNELRIRNAIFNGTIIWESPSGDSVRKPSISSVSKKTATKKKPV